MLSSRCIEKKQAMLCRTNKKICDTKLLELHRRETRGAPRSFLFGIYGYRPEIKLRLADEPTDNHQWDSLPTPKRKEMMAKLAPACRVHDADRRKVWETCLPKPWRRQVPERSPACSGTADREEAAE